MKHNSRAHHLHCCIPEGVIHIGYNAMVSPGVVQHDSLDLSERYVNVTQSAFHIAEEKEARSTLHPNLYL